MRAKYGEVQAFIEEAVKYSGEDCLFWPFSRNKKGYASLWYQGKPTRAYVVVCELTHGPRPSLGYDAAHSCHKGHLGCISPKHIRWLTRQQNCAETILSGEVRAARSAALTGIIRSEETCTKISLSKTNPSQETRSRNRNAALNSWKNEDFRRRQTESRLGSKRITNGFINRTISSAEDIPEGWYRGITKSYSINQ